MSNKTEPPAQPQRSIAFQVLRKAYFAGPLHHSEDTIRVSFHRYVGVLFRAVVLLIALGMLLPMAYLIYRASGVGVSEAINLLAAYPHGPHPLEQLSAGGRRLRRCPRRWHCRWPG